MEIELGGYKYLGKGPSASGSDQGWNRNSKIFYRCANCGDIVKSTYSKNYSCKCGDMFIDFDAARFGSRKGDEYVWVYETMKHNNQMQPTLNNGSAD